MDNTYSRYRAYLVEQGMTEDQMPFKQYLEATYPGDVALQNQLVVAEMVGGNVPRAVARPVLSDVTADADSDLAAGLTAIARTRLSRIADTMNFVDLVEARLMRRINIEEASIDQLLAAGRLLRTSLKDDISLVAEVVRARDEKPIEPRSFNVNITEQVVNIGDAASKMALASRDSRDRSRTLLESMLKVVKKHGEPAEPAA